MHWTRYIGIDYSGRATASTRTSALQVYEGSHDEAPSSVFSPASSERRKRNWCRQEIAHWIVDQVRDGPCLAIGIDHGLSFPVSYFERYGLTCWSQFIEDFCDHWPTAEAGSTVDDIRHSNQGTKRQGSNDEFRLTENWTSSAKSVFQFDVQGSVAKSTHAGLPWVRWIRQELGSSIHVWPFDGWTVPEGRSLLAEVYPSIFRNRYPRGERTVDEQDAYSVASWLREMGQRDLLKDYLEPPLTDRDRAQADLEGWILGVR